MSEDKIKTLLDLGYRLDYRNTYLHKSVYGKGHHNYASIFIDIKTNEISFAGISDYKEKLLKEIEGILK